MATERLHLRLDAPFAACRPFVAGWFRPTAPFLTHSAVYGLLLNVAGVESRLGEHEAGHDGRVPTTLTRPGLPSVRLALGVPAGAAEPRVASIYQQLHNYPVGTSGMDPALSMGTKNNITPVRRELLCDVRAVVAVECDADLAERLRCGLRGEPTGRAYGLPFVGDNSFLLDRFEESPAALARWYERVDPADRPRPGTARLTTRVDRAVMSNTLSALFAPATQAETEPPDAAWVEVGG
jgi:CRISPR-associated protein Cas5t